MKKIEAKKSIELAMSSLKEEQVETKNILETVLREYFAPRKIKCSRTAFRERVIKTLLKPYRRKQPLIGSHRSWIDVSDLVYMYYIKGNKMHVTDKKTVFYFEEQELEDLEDGYYSKKGELFCHLSDRPDDIWEEGCISELEPTIDATDIYLGTSQVEDLAKQEISNDDMHSFSITREGVEKKFETQSKLFKLLQQLFSEPGVKVAIRDYMLIIKAKNIKVATMLVDTKPVPQF